jgi:enoyl-CoA hydratase/3-hydroxyacyl-CoA dehydrogenase
MGSGIATVFVLNNFLVVLKEVNEQFLSAGINRIKGKLFPLTSQTSIEIVFNVSQNLVVIFSQFAEFCQKGTTYQKKLSLLSGVLDYEQFRDADVVKIQYFYFSLTYAIGLVLFTFLTLS